MNYVECNGLNKPQIIIIKAVETLRYNEWSTNGTQQSDSLLLGTVLITGDLQRTPRIE